MLIRLSARLLVCIGVFIGPTAVDLGAADLQERTRQAFERYAQITEARIEQELKEPGRGLWMDRLANAERADAERRLRAGEVLVARLESRVQGKSIEIPDGKVHHWVGTVFIPGATLARTIEMVQGYEHYPRIYQPAIRRSAIVARDGPNFKVSMQMFMKKVISVVLNADFDVVYRSLGPMRMFVPSVATRIAEVENPDTPQAQEKPVGHDNGFLWRFNNYCLFEERDGGTYMQCESVSLSRTIPIGLGWLIGPFVTSIPRESLTFTLTAARRHLTNKGI
ncbi:MAG TPA: hypothetical protein VH702_15800 [Vicinamibacterales bacterium]|jgi:hypothetical protein